MNEAQQITVNIGTDYWWVSPVAIAIVGLGGFFSVWWQLSVQHRNARKIQEKHFQQQLHLKIYREIAEANASCSKAMSSFGVYILMFPQTLQRRMRYSTPEQDYGRGDYTAERFWELRGKASDEMLRVMTTMEKYEIALPGFGIFKERLSKRLSQFHEAYGELYGRIVLLISREGSSQHNIPPPSFPGKKGLAELDKMAKEIYYIQREIQTILWDLRVETQNTLLGNLFKSRVPPRQPSEGILSASTKRKSQ